MMSSDWPFASFSADRKDPMTNDQTGDPVARKASIEMERLVLEN